MTYKVIGLMSGSSLDGLDIAYVHLTEQRGAWSFELKAADCIPYSAVWIDALKAVPDLTLAGVASMNATYGEYIGACVNTFIEQHGLHYAVDFISSHGHTCLHEPAGRATFQLGNGAAIAAATGISTITDLRAMDVALGGQGAPIVPIGDMLLFPGYDAWLNLGGIANITLKTADSLIAFDICACNQILNALASRAGKDFDDGGAMAREGGLLPDLLHRLNAHSYLAQPFPKSLSNKDAWDMGRPALRDKTLATEDLLHTYSQHIAQQIGAAIADNGPVKLLVTGGGALNKFLMDSIRKALPGIEVIVPASDIIQYKEAIVMALIGALRWRGEVNVLASVTGASRDSSGGAIWAGA